MRTHRPALSTLAVTLASTLMLCLWSPAEARAAEPPAAPRVATVAQDLRMMQDAEPMRAVADAFVARALAGNAQASLALLSRGLVERTGETRVRQVFGNQILPFFAQGREVGRSVTVARTTDALGQNGFAFYMWLLANDGAPARPFSIYVVEEQGRVVVANVVPDRLVEGRHR